MTFSKRNSLIERLLLLRESRDVQIDPSMQLLLLLIVICWTTQAGSLSIQGLGRSKTDRKVSVASRKRQLLDVVKDTNFGLSSNAKVKRDVALLVEDLAKMSKARNPAAAFSEKNKPQSPLFGSWDLQYTDAPDVLSIGKIPGVELLYVGQDISNTNTITNVIEAKGFLADSRQEVVVGATQESPTRVALRFLRTKLVFRKIFGRSNLFGRDVSELVKPIEFEFSEEQFAKARARSDRPDPSFEILYLDDSMRVQRTAEEYIFIATKAAAAASVGDGLSSEADADQQQVSLQKDGLGPWLNQKLGSNAMKTLGVVSLIPYLLFFYRFFTEN